jgi:hypothetical protein
MQRTLLHKEQRASVQRYGIQRHMQRAPVCTAWHTYVVIRTREDLGVIVTFQVTITEVPLTRKKYFFAAICNAMTSNAICNARQYATHGIRM